ncbi:MAG: DEAD/DEAH box helicase [Cyanobium sp.]
MRPYQQEAVERLRSAFLAGHRGVLFVLPTGGGKTVVFSHIAQQSASRGNRIAVLVHRVELLEQASKSLDSLGVPHGLIAAGRSMNLAAPVQVASVGTLSRRLNQLPPELFQLLVIDEAHHSNAGQWSRIIQHFSGAHLLGVSATPVRSDGRGLGEFYSELVLGPSAAWLTAHGFLAAARVFAPPSSFAAHHLKKRMGDYDLRQAAVALGGAKIMGDAVSHYRQHLQGHSAIAFCCSVAHAQAVAEAFNSQGIAAASIDGSLDATTRRSLLEQLGSGELQVLTSCSLIGEGVDVPSVVGCILLRPTQSEALHLQMIGRCLRPQSGKQAVILDHVGNIARLGHHLEERPWSLDGVRKRCRQQAPSVKTCPMCFCAMASAAARCPECGHHFRLERRSYAVVAGDLEEVSAAELKQQRKREQLQATSLEELIAFGQRRGMKNPRGWARHVLAARQTKGHWSLVA